LGAVRGKQVQNIPSEICLLDKTDFRIFPRQLSILVRVKITSCLVDHKQTDLVGILAMQEERSKYGIQLHRAIPAENKSQKGQWQTTSLAPIALCFSETVSQPLQ
jgi:hypothetical protein